MSPCKIFRLRRASDENSVRCQHAAWIRVVRGPTRRSFVHWKAPFCKELFVRRRKRSWQLHVMLLPVPRTASILLLRRLIVRLAAAACCCWHRELQWRVEEANLEIFILQGSSYPLCKALVQCECHRTPTTECLVCVHVTGSNSILSGSHAAHLESTKDHGKS